MVRYLTIMSLLLKNLASSVNIHTWHMTTLSWERDSYIGVIKRHFTLDESQKPKFNPNTCLWNMVKRQELLPHKINNVFIYPPIQIECNMMSNNFATTTQLTWNQRVLCLRSKFGVTISYCPPHELRLRNVVSKFISKLLIIGVTLLAITCKPSRTLEMTNMLCSRTLGKLADLCRCPISYFKSNTSSKQV